MTADFTDCPVAIARTLPEMEDQRGVNEIENLSVDLIAAAERYIYVESQYFASAAIARAIVERLSEPDGPEIVIVNPESADGWLEAEIMNSSRARLYQAVKARDKYDRFRMFHPYNAAGTPIYVHAKILIVDDRYIRIGSSNFNNRSLGFDSECDAAIDASATEGKAVSGQIARVRNDLLAEHLGKEESDVRNSLAETGSLIATIEALANGGLRIQPYQTPDINAVEEWLADNDILDPKRADDVFAGII